MNGVTVSTLCSCFFLKVKPTRTTECMCHTQDYDVGVDVQREAQRGVHTGVKSVGLVLTLTSLYLIIVPLWFEGICIAPYQSTCKENGHIGTHLGFGSKRLCTPRFVHHVHDCQRVDQLDVFQEVPDLLYISTILIFSLEL
jgi:hypothetical protein